MAHQGRWRMANGDRRDQHHQRGDRQVVDPRKLPLPRDPEALQGGQRHQGEPRRKPEGAMRGAALRRMNTSASMPTAASAATVWAMIGVKPVHMAASGEMRLRWRQCRVRAGAASSGCDETAGIVREVRRQRVNGGGACETSKRRWRPFSMPTGRVYLSNPSALRASCTWGAKQIRGRGAL